jgi:hypothetical protein
MALKRSIETELVLQEIEAPEGRRGCHGLGGLRFSGGGRKMAKTDVEVRLVGEDGNAFGILGRVSKALRKAGYDQDFVNGYMKEATAGDYDHLLLVTMDYVHVL